MIAAGIGGMFLFSHRSWDLRRYPVGVVGPYSTGSVEVPGTGLYTVKAIGADGFVLSEQQISVSDASGAALGFSEAERKWTLEETVSTE